MTIEEFEKTFKKEDQVDMWETISLLYTAAVKEMETKISILSDDFQHAHRYNPIEHIKTRVKTPESIVNKLNRYEKEITMENMVKHIKDIAGIRIICSFTSDIYRLAKIIGSQDDIRVLSIKDYIREPKESGYKSYHMIVSIPVFLTKSVVETPVELQIRTIAMDFWASLEHKLNYKLEGEAPENIKNDLKACAKMVSELDEKMMSLNEAIIEALNDNK